MDMTHLVDQIISKYMTDHESWDKFDAPKMSTVLNKKLVKTVLDVCSKVQGSRNMLSERNVQQRIDKIRKYRVTLKRLKDIPLIEQRTPEWYALRQSMITASDFGDALAIDKFGKKTDPNKIYEKKCGYEPPIEYDNASIFLKWGVMFEPVATSLYEHRNNTKVHEFGLVQNPRHSFLGASPDGITEGGVMLEIKCPYKRVITEDSILKQYFYQIQGQLDACDLEECDFLEVRFDKYENLEEFLEDYETEFECFTNNYKEKGIIIEKSEGVYLYSPFNKSREEVIAWYNQNKNDSFNVVFWFMHSFTVKRVLKDPCFIDTMNKQLEDVWTNIVKYRNDKSLYMKEVKTPPPKAPRQKRQSSHVANHVGSMFLFDPNE